MIVKIISLKLKNFKGVKDFSLSADGDNISIFSDNATGKTTLYDTVCWLLFEQLIKGITSE